MSAYIIVRATITDMDQYKNYMAGSPALVTKYGGKFVVRGSPVTTLEGETETRRVVVLEFPTHAQAEAFYHSPEYTELKQKRLNAAEAQFILVDGYTP